MGVAMKTVLIFWRMNELETVWWCTPEEAEAFAEQALREGAVSRLNRNYGPDNFVERRTLHAFAIATPYSR